MSKIIVSETVSMLPSDMSNFVELIKCNTLEAELDPKKAKHYKIIISEEK